MRAKISTEDMSKMARETRIQHWVESGAVPVKRVSEKKKDIYGLIGIILCLIGSALAVVITVYRFKHPAMTRTQLFLSLWKENTLAIIAVIVGSKFVQKYIFKTAKFNRNKDN